MQKYGIIQNGQFQSSDTLIDGYKPVVYADFPVFNQATQYVQQGETIENEDNIEVGYEVKDLEVQEESGDTEETEQEIVIYPPRNERRTEDVKLESLESENAELIFQSAIQDLTIFTLQTENAELLFRLANLELGGM